MDSLLGLNLPNLQALLLLLELLLSEDHLLLLLHLLAFLTGLFLLEVLALLLFL